MEYAWTHISQSVLTMLLYVLLKQDREKYVSYVYQGYMSHFTSCSLEWWTNYKDNFPLTHEAYHN